MKNTIKELLKTYDNPIIDVSKVSEKHIYVNLIKTYERIAEKGYKSIEIFQKLGNAYFFDGDYVKAAKWNGELFKNTIDTEYYERFAYSFAAIREKDKAEEIITKRDQLSGINK
ncbi:MAG: flagellar motor protein MotB [Flavobacterium sp.]|nr:flagellar motor protein MotB [Flavobacterium sp.]